MLALWRKNCDAARHGGEDVSVDIDLEAVACSLKPAPE